jgi:hypothetical protein
MTKIVFSFSALFLILGVVFGSLANANDRTNQAVALETPIITSGPGEFTSDTTPTFAFSGPSEAGFECQVVAGGELGDNFQACTSPYTVAQSLEDGEYEFQVYASTNRGENISEVAYWDFTVTTKNPDEPTLRTTPAKRTKDKAALISFRAANRSLTSFCKLDNNKETSCRSSAYYRNLSDGNHVFRVYSQDEAGNKSKTVTYRWIVDTKRPVIKFTQTPKPQNNTKRVTFKWSVNEEVRPVSESGSPKYAKCSLGRSSQVDCSSPASFRPKRGGNTFIVRVRDLAGNSGYAYYRFRQLR